MITVLVLFVASFQVFSEAIPSHGYSGGDTAIDKQSTPPLPPSTNVYSFGGEYQQHSTIPFDFPTLLDIERRQWPVVRWTEHSS